MMNPRALVTDHLWLVPLRCRALGLRTSHSLWDDAIQDGSMGLMKAAERFDDTRGVRFERYARPWVDNAIKQCFCAQQVVAEPIKRISARAARGERAHPQTVPYTESSLDKATDSQTNHGRSAVVARYTAREWEDCGGEDAVAESLDQARSVEWLRARLNEVLPEERDALLATARDVGVCEFARRARVCRETVRTRTNAGLEYLRAEAIGDEIGRASL
jgi:RNA polymerase sigma factor (sigma-70 family)